MSTPNDHQSQEPDVPEDEGQTLAGDGSFTDEDGQTVAGGSPADDTARHPERAEENDSDQTLADPLLAGNVPEDATGGDEGRTVVESFQTDDGPVMDPPEEVDQFDQTIADDALASGVPAAPESDRTIVEVDGDDVATVFDGGLAGGRDEPAPGPPADEFPSEQTVVDPAAGSEETGVAGDEHAGSEPPDGTVVVSPDAEGHQATQFDPDLAEGSDRTVVQGSDGSDSGATELDGDGGADEFDQTVVEDDQRDGRTAGRPSDPGDVEATIISQDGSEPAPDSRKHKSRSAGGRRRPGAHETADRWETQQRYQLVSNFARGGLGQIWLAQDSRLRREVAFKELLPSALKNRNALERFLEEAQITGQLEHPGIVPIYDIGYQQNGTPFYAMKLVRGETMEKHIEMLHQLPRDSPEFSLTFRKLLRNFIDICNALAFAHDRGVLHRDLKPLNVMLGAFGETLVLDWGLAKVLDVPVADSDVAPITTEHGGGFSVDEQTVIQSTDGESAGSVTQGATAGAGRTQSAATTGGSVTQGGHAQGTTSGGESVGGRTQQMSGTFGTTRRMVITDVRSVGSQTMMGSVMGTPAYMPPEQGRGDLEQLDARSDIYSLGGILYKLLTNHQPIAKGKIREVLKNVTEGNIIPPHEHDSRVPRPLEAVCLKAMARDRDDRYSTALELAQDVEAWLADEPVSCFEDPWTVKARRWARRHRTAVMTASGTVVTALLMTAGVWWAHAARIDAIRISARASLRQAEAAAAQGDFNQSRDLLNAAIGRVSVEEDLTDLLASLQSRQTLLDAERLRRIERDVEDELEAAADRYRQGDYQNARAQLVELQTRLADEQGLPELSAAVQRTLNDVEQAIEKQAAVAATADRFSRFLELCDEARARGSLQTMDNVDDDARLAQKHAVEALELFGLNTPEPFASVPEHFEESLPWTVSYHDRTGRWPLEELRSNALELLLILGDMEVQLARNQDADGQRAAAERALTCVARARSIGIESVALLGNESLWLQLAGRDDESRQVLARARELTPSTSLDFYLLAEAERKSNRFREALELYQRAQQLSPTSYWPQHFTGLCHMQLGEVQAALACFTNCISLRENYAWPWMLRGVCNAELERIDAALQDFDTAEQLDPGLYNVPVNRGVVLTVTGRFDEAIAQFERAAEIAPAAAQPHVNIATTHFHVAQHIAEGKPPFESLSDVERLQQEQERYGLALDALAVAADSERAPDHPGIHQLRGRIQERSGNTQAALASYRQHLRVEPNDASRAVTLHRIGSIHFQLGEYQPALEAFQQAYALRPHDARIVRDLAETHLQLRQPQEAEQKYDEFLNLVNADIEERLGHPDIVFNGMATAQNLQRRKRKANEFYTLSLMFNPEQAGVLSQRGWLLLTDSLQLARADFEAAVKQNSNDPHTLTGLALTQTRLGDWRSALKNMEAALPAAVEQARRAGPQGFALFHNAATVYAQCIMLVERDQELDSDVRTGTRAALYEQLERLLRLARQIASPSPAVLRQMQQAVQVEPEFDHLRSRSEFAALLEELTRN